MKAILIFAILLLPSCASVKVDTVDNDGRDWHIKSTTFFKDIVDVKANVGDVGFSLGSSASVNPIPNEVIACLLAPALCK